MQNIFSVKLKLDCEFKIYKTRCNFKLCKHFGVIVNVDCIGHRDDKDHFSSDLLTKAYVVVFS